MKYMGSKARHAKELLPIILKDRKEGQWYVEPFVGGANMIDKVDGLRWGNELFTPQAELLIALENGWIPPLDVSEDHYYEVKSDQQNYPAHYLGYVGFQLSYGAVYFSTYRRDKSGIRNYSHEAYRNVVKQAPKLEGVKFTNLSYEQMDIPTNSVIYCDPPYAKTTGYKTGDFDHNAFWQWCRDKVKEGHKVFVSEYSAPEDFISVWEKKVNNTLAKDTGSKQGVEKLFIHRSQL